MFVFRKKSVALLLYSLCVAASPRTLLADPTIRCIPSWRQLAGKAANHSTKAAFYPYVLPKRYYDRRKENPGAGRVRSLGKVLWTDKLHIAGFFIANLIIAPLADPTVSLPSLNSNAVDLDFYILYPDDYDDDIDEDAGFLKRAAKRFRRLFRGSTSDNTHLVVARDNWLNPRSRDIAMNEGVETLIKTLRRLKAEGRRVRDIRIMGHGDPGYIGSGSGYPIGVPQLREHEAELAALAKDTLLRDSKVFYLSCETGEGEEGQSLVDETQRILGLQDGAVSANKYKLVTAATVGASEIMDVLAGTRILNGIASLSYRLPGMKVYSSHSHPKE